MPAQLPGMVATSQRQATDAGLIALRAGGSAADAAIAAAAALAVTEPTSTGIGGDCFALYYEATTGAVTALNGSGRAPAALTLDRARAAFTAQHASTVTVPGACAGWFDLIERHGRLSMPAILEPAIALAEDGFEVGPITAHFWKLSEPLLAAAANARELTIEGRAPAAGERFRNPGMVRTLRAIAAGGPEAFYRGPIAEAIVDVLAGAGGCMTAGDLAGHRSTWDRPISTVYRGHTVWECPPNGQGLAALLALNVLEGFELGALDPLGAERWHLAIEALRLAFADTRWYAADPAFAPAPLEALLSAGYAAERRSLVGERRADIARGAPVAGSDTVYLCAVDGDGNACSFINSNYMGFGTAIVPAGWGFPLQNRGYNFSLEPGHPNAVAPGKRPYHTIIPGLITRADGSLHGPFGVMGGFMQPQGHVQVVSAMLDDGASPQQALDRPRFCIEPAWGDGQVFLEDGVPAETARALTERGHRILPGIGGFGRSLFGRGQIIRRDPDGTLTGGSDVRADGCAAAG